MSLRNFGRLIVVAVFATAGAWLYNSGLNLADLSVLATGSPHQRYTVALKYRGIANSAAGTAWIESAEQALVSATAVQLPRKAQLVPRQEAAAYVVRLRRGQRYVIDATTTPGTAPRKRASDTPDAVFIDVFEREDTALRRVGSAAAGATSLALDIRSDGEYVVRVQPELNHNVQLTVALHVEPTLRVPVQRSKAANIQSFFGDARDGGRRRHHGVDIFAKRGTPVIAAGDGIVSSVGTNRLGGNVVWVARPGHREFHYYAHLDQQLVKPGTLVKAGDVLGTVGNTGNAKRTPPHLHFGIYAAGGPVDPLPYIAPQRG